jgi:hypothetical protein
VQAFQRALSVANSQTERESATKKKRRFAFIFGGFRDSRVPRRILPRAASSASTMPQFFGIEIPKGQVRGARDAPSALPFPLALAPASPPRRDLTATSSTAPPPPTDEEVRRR